jgi:hypothetical protein
LPRRSAWCAALLAGTCALGARTARGQEAEDVSPGLRGPRFGLTAGVGVGFAGFTGNVAFPSSVFTTVIQGEALLELTRWGFFVRGGFLSSGGSGRWTAPLVALGSQYRLVGDGEERLGVVVRGAFLYERWSAVAAQVGCDVYYFFPNSCQNLVAPAESPGAALPPPAVTADSVGLLVALRVEMPVEPVYVAFEGELSAAADVDQSVPGLAVAGQLVLTFALRDHPKPAKGPQEYRMRRRPF